MTTRDDRLPVPSPEQTAIRFAPQFEACESLLDVVWSGRPSGLESIAKYQHVLLHILGRTISSYRASLLLCRDGLTTQALMVSRSLYEDMIAAHWAALPEHRETVLDLVIKQERHNDELEEEVSAEFEGRAAKLALSVGERKDLDELFRRGTRSWFGKLSDARERIKPLVLARGGDLRTLAFFDRALNKEANTRLHNTVAGLHEGAMGTVRYQGRVYPGYGQLGEVDDYEMRRALFAASSFFGITAGLVFDELGAPTEGVGDASQAISHALFDLMPEQRAKLGRNEPCWCGSGKKLKKCHDS